MTWLALDSKVDMSLKKKAGKYSHVPFQDPPEITIDGKPYTFLEGPDAFDPDIVDDTIVFYATLLDPIAGPDSLIYDAKFTFARKDSTKADDYEFGLSGSPEYTDVDITTESKESKKQAAEPALNLPEQEEPPKRVAPTPEDMARRRIELTKKLEVIDEEIAKLKAALEEDLKSLEEQTGEEEPLLMAILETLPDKKMIIDGWIAKLKERKAYTTPKSGEVLDELERITQETHKDIYNLIVSLRASEKYRTPIPEKKDIEVKREPRKKSFLSIREAQSYWQKFKSWLSRVLAPLWSRIDSNFYAMEDLLVHSEVEEA